MEAARQARELISTTIREQATYCSIDGGAAPMKPSQVANLRGRRSGRNTKFVNSLRNSRPNTAERDTVSSLTDTMLFKSSSFLHFSYSCLGILVVLVL